MSARRPSPGSYSTDMLGGPGESEGERSEERFGKYTERPFLFLAEWFLLSGCEYLGQKGGLNAQVAPHRRYRIHVKQVCLSPKTRIIISSPLFVDESGKMGS